MEKLSYMEENVVAFKIVYEGNYKILEKRWTQKSW